MKLTWFGHAAFLVETDGKRIILDPYRWPDAGGYLAIDETADVVLVSHENDRYHSHLGQIRLPFEVLRALEFPNGTQTWRDLTFHAIHVYENAQKLAEDEVTIIYFDVEGLRIAFLGDLGHPLSDGELQMLGQVDILLAATGGTPTIPLDELHTLIDAIRPRVIVPMHYRIEGKINLNILPVERFLEEMKGWRVDKHEGSSIELTREKMPAEPTIVWLQPAR